MMVTSLLISVIFNTLTSFSLAFTLGSLNSLDWRGMLFIGMVFITVLWATDYTISHVFWSSPDKKKNFASYFLVVVRVLGVVACGCITIPFWATYAEPIQYQNYVNTKNLERQAQLDQPFDEQVLKLREQYVSPYDLKIQKAFEERENLSRKLETHKDQFLIAKDELGKASQEKNYQLRGQENPNKNGRGPLFVQAESAEAAAQMKSDALDKLIASDEQALAVVYSQLELLNAEREVATKEFEKLKAELEAKRPKYIPVGYGDLSSKLNYLYDSFKENPLNSTFPLGIMFLVLLFDSFSICSITCFKPYQYISLLDSCHENDKIISETKILINHYKIMQELNVSSHEAEILASEENHRFFKDLGEVSNLSLGGFNLVAKEKVSKPNPGNGVAPQSALPSPGGSGIPPSQVPSPGNGGAPPTGFAPSGNGGAPPTGFTPPGNGGAPPSGLTHSGHGQMPPSALAAKANERKRPSGF
ncbi:MAG: DUF4407 domain-containing protein [Deltaproteobacteria bacterium]|nr:DUF4407 domain-containing protein [Deltaproteobacteria bacterium]